MAPHISDGFQGEARSPFNLLESDLSCPSPGSWSRDMSRFLLVFAAISFFAAPPCAEAQIVRRIIGHAVAGKAVKSITGQDKDASGKEAFFR